MYMKNSIKKIVILALLPLVFGGCSDLFSTQDRTFQGDPVVEITPGNTSVDEGESVTLDVQLIGEQRSSDLEVNISTGGEAQAGTHYSAPGSSVTINAESSAATLAIDTIDGSLDSGDTVELVVELTGTNDSDISVAENLGSSTVTIVGL